MKIKKDFAPVTIVIETELEHKKLLMMLMAAESYYDGCRNGDMRESVTIFINDIKKA